MNSLMLNQEVSVQLVKGRKLESRFEVGGMFHLELYRKNELIQVQDFHNDVVPVGKQYLLNLGFANTGSILTPWYVGIVSGSSPSFASTDTMASHTGWSESTYAGARQTWGPSAATISGSVVTITATAAATFNITGSETLGGVFITNSSASGSDSTGQLWATALFGSGSIAVVNADQIKITYSLSC